MYRKLHFLRILEHYEVCEPIVRKREGMQKKEGKVPSNKMKIHLAPLFLWSSTMCDFHNFGLIFVGQMHCLPQRLKSTFV